MIPGLGRPASLASLCGSVIRCLEGDPEKAWVEGCWRAGEERPDPEMLSRRLVAVKSWLGSIRAGLNTPRRSGWSRRYERSEFLLVAEKGCCVKGEEVKLWGYSTEVLLVPGGLAGSLLAVDPGRVALLEAQQAEFLLVERVAGS